MRRLISMLCGLALAAGWLAPAAADRAQARAWVEEGARLQASGKPDEALALYERAIAADPDYLLAYEAAAPLWLSRGQDEVVIERFERVTLRHPDYPFGWYTLAYAYRRAGRLEHAIMAYETCIDLRPGDAEPYFGLAMVHKKAGNPAEALAAFERYVALETRPARAEYVNQARREITALREQMAATRGAAGMDDSAAGAEDSAAGAEESVGESAAESAGESVAGAGEGEMGSSGAGEIAVSRGGDGVRHGDTGLLASIHALMAQGRYASAAALAERVAPRSAGEGVALLMIRAEIAAEQGRYGDARMLAWAALAAAPFDRDVYELLGRLY